jgi:hypothetical protein
MKLHETEINNAKNHIAHQMAIRDRCIVDTGALHITDGKDDFYLSDYGFDYNDEYIDELIDRIEVIAVYIFQEITVVIGKDSQEPAIENPKFSKTFTERPQWIRNPQIVRNILGDDYFVGIGIADKYTQFYKGIYTADLDAAQTIASEKERQIDIYSMDTAENKSAHYASGTLSMSEGVELTGFRILDRWIEPDLSKCYSLGIARKF